MDPTRGGSRQGKQSNAPFIGGGLELAVGSKAPTGHGQIDELRVKSGDLSLERQQPFYHSVDEPDSAAYTAMRQVNHGRPEPRSWLQGPM